ncbi:NIPSNAP family protein [Amycolatopsis benzoatilytica]|uniref:NIPSNAP family protein n=1 Tax=Amycolatopsis benzoatilytica TaxID=346045 RepID=UPI001FE19CFE|nr:NIPSNAP family protein [Amycolatopsis benzoatilytica]
MTVVELRQYTLLPGKRDALIELFDREFVESQEAAGATVIGQFRDADDPDRFVWFRSFPDLTARHAALTEFYVEGEAWRRHRAAANATMLDSDDVLLLRPARADSGFPSPDVPRPAVGAAEVPRSRVLVVVCSRPTMIDQDFFEREAGLAPTASFVTERAENTFRALPVREGECVRVWVWLFPDTAALRGYQRRLTSLEGWTRLSEMVQVLRLVPTARSWLR